MNAAHLHLLLNHFPVIGSVFLALLLAEAARRRSDELTRAALALAGVVGALAAAAYLTGEPAESLVERLPDVSEALIEAHEDAALVATIVVGTLGALALLTLLLARNGRPLPRRAAAISLGLALVACVAMGYTAYLGGRIRHTEIRGVAPPPTPRAGSDDR